jgi:hypothetical protein
MEIRCFQCGGEDVKVLPLDAVWQKGFSAINANTFMTQGRAGYVECLPCETKRHDAEMKSGLGGWWTRLLERLS